MCYEMSDFSNCVHVILVDVWEIVLLVNSKVYSRRELFLVNCPFRNLIAKRCSCDDFLCQTFCAFI